MSKTQDYSQLVDEYRRCEVNVKTRPAGLYISTISGCPFSCIMCKPRGTKQSPMEPDLKKSIESYLADAEVVLVDGSSEPLTDDVNYWVKQANDNNFVLHMETNGYLLSEEMAKLLVSTDRLSIRFSFHAARPDTFYRVMGISMEKTVENIKQLVKMSQKSSKKHDFWLSYCVMKENIHEIEDLFHVAHDCGIRSLRLMRLLPTLRILLGIKLRGMTFRFHEQTGKQVDRVFFENLPRYKALAEELGITIEFGDKENDENSLGRMIGGWANLFANRLFHRSYFPLKPAKSFPCAAPWIGELGIKVNGDVRLCCGSNYLLGNLNETTLDEIWQGPKMQKVLQAFKDGRYPRICGYCKGFGFADYPNNSFPGIRN